MVCDDELSDGHLQDLWEVLRWTPVPPVFIVSSYLADERLWAEVLNLGAYDVIAKTLSWLKSSEFSRKRSGPSVLYG